LVFLGGGEMLLSWGGAASQDGSRLSPGQRGGGGRLGQVGKIAERDKRPMPVATPAKAGAILKTSRQTPAEGRWVGFCFRSRDVAFRGRGGISGWVPAFAGTARGEIGETSKAIAGGNDTASHSSPAKAGTAREEWEIGPGRRRDRWGTRYGLTPVATPAKAGVHPERPAPRTDLAASHPAGTLAP